LTAERPPSAQELRHAFDAAPDYSVGLEDEVMLLDPEDYQLAPRGPEVLGRLDGDERFKLELPASQLEIVTPPVRTVPEAIGLLADGRTELVRRCQDQVRPAAAGAHPFSSGTGELNQLPQYHHTVTEFGWLAHRQLVCAFQVHVAPGSAERALAVYNAARSYLPLLAALAANAPFYEGQDTGLASIRPKLCELLPRQGVPPPIETWEQLAESLAWGNEAGSFHPGAWWWELRPHRRFGTLEFRVPDAQSSVADAAALAAVVQSLVAWLGQRHQAGEALAGAAQWRIEENRWSACRYGLEGGMADLETGQVRPTRDCLYELLGVLAPVAESLGCSPALAQAHELAELNGAIRQRRVAGEGGMIGLGRWLAERFSEPWPG
jgi:carboxylate-amine ligase